MLDGEVHPDLVVDSLGFSRILELIGPYFDIKIQPRLYNDNFTAGGHLLNEFRALERILIGDSGERDLMAERSDNDLVGFNTDGARARILLEVCGKGSAQ